MPEPTTATRPDTARQDRSERHHVTIIGAGFSGLGMAIELRRRGYDDIVVLDRGAEIGGTWRDNTYPGAACDIPAHLYSLSTAPNPDWSTAYAGQAEIFAHMRAIADENGLRPHLRYDASVEHAGWDEDSATWTVTTRDGRRFVSQILVSAIGGLRDPLYPGDVDRSAFEGPQFHSSRWDHGADLTGKRIGVVGTGASAIQLVPEVAQGAAHTTVFQRTAPWVIPRSNRRYTAFEQRLFRRIPLLQRVYRRLLYLQHEVFYFAVFNRTAPLSGIVQRLAARYIRRELSDPALAATLTPTYRFGCKRVAKSSYWYRTLDRPDVTTVTSGVASVTASGVVTEAGEHVELDVLIWATGFSILDFAGDLRISGRDGFDLDRAWAERPSAWMGHAVPGFPNLFLLLGPNTGLGHNSVVLMSEAQIEHAAAAIEHIATTSTDVLEVRPERLTDWLAEIDRRFVGQTWAAGCASWYLTPAGENFTLWPGSVIEYRRRASRFDVAAYEQRSRVDATPNADGVLVRVPA